MATGNVMIPGSHDLTIQGRFKLSVGGERVEQVQASSTTSVALSQVQQVGEHLSIEAGKSVVIHAADMLELRCGNASIVLKKDGTVQIKGLHIGISANGKIDIKAAGDVVIKGSKVSQN